MPNLENLKKQAKQILKWHRERHWPVAEEIRNALPQFASMSDREILDHELKLADAQLLVAKRAGFDSWSALKRTEDGSSDDTDELSPRLTSVVPGVFVSDVDRASDYYSTTLGFNVVFKYGQPPFYGQIERDGLRIALRSVDQYILEAQRTRRKEEELLAAFFHTVGVKALYNEYLDAGANFYQKLRTEPWGARTFVVEDPDGNLIAFHEDNREG